VDKRSNPRNFITLGYHARTVMLREAEAIGRNSTPTDEGRGGSGIRVLTRGFAAVSCLKQIKRGKKDVGGGGAYPAMNSGVQIA